MPSVAGSHPEPDRDADGLPDEEEINAAVTTAADVESAGRSCLVILVLGVIILLLLLVWALFR